MLEFASSQHLTALFQVIMIDLVLAGDNAIVIGLAAAGLPEGQRKKAILIGIVAATILRIGFASVTVQLLQIIGLLLAGGVLLLWVCWKMWRELRTSHHQPTFQSLPSASTMDATTTAARQKTLGQAVWQITLADVSMSLDNVLAVAGAAREHPMILIFGLALSIALMGFAASFIARLLEKHRCIAYVGLAIILYVPLDMCYRGVLEVAAHPRLVPPRPKDAISNN
ncbi:TerC family protein [Bradyrhizobium sp. McL0615]|uniref:TerC family protein n=1 Tax=Bradyrhizobium sp. McL0615 TaxID=3415673 RepID=UPI003CECA31C